MEANQTNSREISDYLEPISDYGDKDSLIDLEWRSDEDSLIVILSKTIYINDSYNHKMILSRELQGLWTIMR